MVRVVDRVGDILGSFTSERPELTLTECASAVMLNKSSALRLLQSLESIGLVERNGPLWRLGPRVMSMWAVRVAQMDLRRDAMKELRRLRETLREAVAFSIPDDHHMLYLERLDSPSAFGVSARLGSRAPMFAGGSGKAVLACLDDERQAGRLATPEWERLPKAQQARVLKEIAEARRRGYCVDHGDFYDGIGGVGAAVCDMQGDPVAAVSVVVPSDRLTPAYATDLGERLTAVVATLQAALGSSP